MVAGSIDPWFNADLKTQYADSIKAIAQTIVETSIEGYNGCTGALAAGNQAANVGKIKNTTMYLVGSLDGPFPPLMKKMHEDTPGSSYVVIEGATHVSNLTHPKEFNAALRKFLS
jgi:pimeloyl-ACP methyl ester carboxylesterase